MFTLRTVIVSFVVLDVLLCLSFGQRSTEEPPTVVDETSTVSEDTVNQNACRHAMQQSLTHQDNSADAMHSSQDNLQGSGGSEEEDVMCSTETTTLAQDESALGDKDDQRKTDEEVLKEKVAEVEAEPVILTARV